MVVVVWVASRGAERAAVAKKNGELRLRRTITDACPWRSCELLIAPLPLLAARCFEFSLT